MVGWKSTLFACATTVAAHVFSMPAWSQDVIWWSPDWGKARAEKPINDFQATNPDIKIHA
jgi:multiple sugar transport system substrate-binding protein